MTDIRNRIVGDGIADPRELIANPQNWRLHPARQLEALRGILANVGFVQKVIVNKTTGFILDGHARVELAASQGAGEIPVVYVELDPKYCDVIVKRWQDFSGCEAILEETGQTFADVAAGLLPEGDD